MKKTKHPRMIAINPTTRGFGFCVFESPERLLDAGLATARIRHVTQTLCRFEKLIHYYQPQLIVIENTKDPASKKGARSQKILEACTQYSHAHMIPVRRINRTDVKALFAEFNAYNKQDIADHLVEWLPDLKIKRPPRKDVWKKEDERMSIFDAAALAIYFYSLEQDYPSD